jgi:hypothetical protein
MSSAILIHGERTDWNPAASSTILAYHGVSVGQLPRRSKESSKRLFAASQGQLLGELLGDIRSGFGRKVSIRIDGPCGL